MNSFRLRTLALGCALVIPFSASAQRVYGPQGRSAKATLDSLIGQLPDSLRTMARTLAESDSVDARAMAGNRLLDHAVALRFLFTVVPHDPAPKVRQYSIMNSYAMGHVGADAFARETLEWMAVEDPDPAIAHRALKQLRSFATKPLRQIMEKRMTRLKQEGEAAVLANAIIEDDYVNLDDGIMLPSFMRIAAEPFEVLPSSRKSVRVLAFGDWGTGRPSQGSTAAAMRAYHKSHAFDFAITLGDNFYPEGVDSPDDPRWRTQYEEMYSPMGIKVYAALGNHDRYNGETPAAEILYSQKSKTWRMPAQNYTYTAGAAQFWSIDGSDMTSGQLAWLRSSLEKSTAKWKIVYAHYPLYSASGGGREGHLTPKLLPVLQGRADVYVAGHHHSMQHLKPYGTLHHFVAGSGGAGSYAVDSANERAHFALSTYGFAVFEVAEKEIKVRFVDSDGKERYATTVKK
jgi:tartrate-resistant acid phosphatase type 5